MRSTKAHLLLSDLHRLLATYEAVDFEAALLLSPNLASTLSNLIDILRTERNRVVHGTRPNGKQPAKADAGLLINDIEGMLSALRKSIYWESMAKLRDLATRHELPVKSRNKESRFSFAQRILESAKSTGRAQTLELLGDVLEHTQSQTAGWVEVLQNNR